VGIIAAVTIITVKNSDKEVVAVVDNSGIFDQQVDSNKTIKFVSDGMADTSNFTKKGYSAILYSPNTGINTSDNWRVYSKKNFSIIASSEVEKKISENYENDLLRRYGVNVMQIDSIRKASKKLVAETAILEDGAGKTKKGNSGVAYGVGYGAAFLIYITLFIYGTMVLRGVMEEKTNRIAEVIVSSVKPTQLMMGKIIGIGAVGLTQFFMWIILIFGLTTLIGAFLPPEIANQVAGSQGQMPGQSPEASTAINVLTSASSELSSVNWPLTIFCFVFYFLFGYLFYAALFAAVGSTVNEDPQDAQSLMLPITMPIVLAIIIMMNAIIHPEGALATWSSMIPFFSPIVMMARIPFGVPGTVPWWQLGLSMSLLVAGFLFTTWLSAKIYRTGILLYGKKATWKEMGKWLFR
jgi:ABC-2 type transport system permease protein